MLAVSRACCQNLRQARLHKLTRSGMLCGLPPSAGPAATSLQQAAAPLDYHGQLGTAKRSLAVLSSRCLGFTGYQVSPARTFPSSCHRWRKCSRWHSCNAASICCTRSDMLSRSPCAGLCCMAPEAGSLAAGGLTPACAGLLPGTGARWCWRGLRWASPIGPPASGAALACCPSPDLAGVPLQPETCASPSDCPGPAGRGLTRGPASMGDGMRACCRAGLPASAAPCWPQFCLAAGL